MDLYVNKRGVPRIARNGRIYTQSGISSTSGSSSGMSVPPASLTPVSEFMEWVADKYKPYAAKKGADPGYPYLYNDNFESFPSFATSLLSLDSMFAVSWYLYVSNGSMSEFLSLAYQYLSIQNGDYIGYFKGLANSGIQIHGEKLNDKSTLIKIGATRTDYNFKGEYIEVDDFTQTFKIYMTNVLFSKIGSKTTPVDADSVLLIDSADSSRTKKLTWVNVKAALQSYFDPIYGLFGSAVYNEMQIGGLQLFDEGVNSPTLTTKATNQRIRSFSGSVMNELFFEFILPETYKEGTDIHIVFHWEPMTSPASNQQVYWQADYQWINVYAAESGGSTTNTGIAHTTTTTGFTHRKVATVAITGTGKTRGSVISGRLFRDPANANDTYTGGAGLFSVGIKHQISSIGSL